MNSLYVITIQHIDCIGVRRVRTEVTILFGCVKSVDCLDIGDHNKDGTREHEQQRDDADGTDGVQAEEEV